MKKFVVLCISLVLVLSLFAACTQEAPPAVTPPATPAPTPTTPATPATPPVPADEEISLRFGWWGNPARNEQTTAVLELFMEENPHIHVEELQAGWGDYWPMLLTLAAAGDLPDVMQNDISRLLEFTENNLIVDLDPFFADGRIDVSEIPDSIIEAGRVLGEVVALPIGMNVTAVIYNRTLLDELGLSAPRNMTLDQWIDLSREIYTLSGVRTIFGARDDPANQMEVILRSRGIVAFQPGGMGGTAEDYVEFFEVIRLGIEEGWHIRAEDLAGRAGMPQDPLVYPPDIEANANLRTWNSPAWSNMIVGLQNEAGEDTVLGLTTYPSAAPQIANFGRPSMYLSITSHTDHPDAAAALIDFWVNTQAAHEIMLAERGVIPNTRIANAVYDMLSPMAQLQSEFVGWMADGNSTPVNPPRPEGSGEVLAEILLITEAVTMGQLTPEQAAQRLFDFGNSVIR